MRGRLLIAGAAALILLHAGPARAQTQGVEIAGAEVFQPKPYGPAPLPQSAITLGEAVLLALRHDPGIRTAAERARAAQGRFAEARGVFDPVLRLQPQATYDLTQITPGLFKGERERREVLLVVRNVFEGLTDGFRDAITGSEPFRIPLCPASLGLSNGRLLDLSGSLTLNFDVLSDIDRELLGRSGLGNTNTQLTIDFDDLNMIDLSEICAEYPRKLFDPNQFVGVYRRMIRVIDQSGDRGLEGILKSVEQIPRESYILQEQIYRAVSDRADLGLARLGPIASEELKRNAKLDVTFTKPFRGGLIATANYQLQAQEHNFVDKPLDPSFGGLGTPPQFFSSVFGTLTMPLFRGRGASTAAPERAARALADSEEHQLRHVASETAFRAVLSYLDVIAAQERVRILEGSAARQQQLLDLSQQRVTAGDLAQAEVARVQARVARVNGSLELARANLVSARVALADTLGVSVESVDAAPMATEAFSAGSATIPAIEQLFSQALAMRRDLRAAALRREASIELLAAARADARPLFDVEITAGMSNLFDSPFFRYFADERGAIVSRQTGVPVSATTGSAVTPARAYRYFDPRGYRRAFTGRYEPFATVRLTFELPFGNNDARGRVAQAQADLERASTQYGEIPRLMHERIADVTGAVARAAAGVEQAQVAAARNQETLESALRLFRTGDQTLIDAITTEESLVGDELLLLTQRQAYLSALARLKFELGELVLVDGSGTTERLRFLPSDFVMR
jgi:outer membrane protein TolC